MPTRFDRNIIGENAISTGYEGNNYASIEIPSCGIEDIDKAMFNLFNKDLPLFYELEGERKRVPVIFASGERFALLKRKKPLRDRNGTIILPLISITRTGLENNPSKGVADNQMLPHIIKRKIAPEDAAYQQLINKENFFKIIKMLEKKKEIDVVNDKNLFINKIKSKFFHTVISDFEYKKSPSNKNLLSPQSSRRKWNFIQS